MSSGKDLLPQSLTAKDIQKYLQISKSKAYLLFHEEDFPTIKFGGSKRVDRDEFLQWVESRKVSSNKG